MSWFAVQTQPQIERSTATRLAELFPVFLPLHRPANRPVSPLFRGYFFVSAQSAVTLGPVMRTPGVVRVLGQSRRQVPVRAGLVEAMLERQGWSGAGKITDGCGVVLDETPSVADYGPALQPGQAVRIISGPMSSFLATVIDARQDHVRLIATLFRRPCAATVHRAQVELAA